MGAMPKFDDFIGGPGGQLIARVVPQVTASTTWKEYTQKLAYADRDEMVAAVRQSASVASTSEIAVLAAAVYAADFAWLADEICDGSWFGKLQYTSGAHKKSILACIAKLN